MHSHPCRLASIIIIIRLLGHMPTTSPMHDVSALPCDVIYEEGPNYSFAEVGDDVISVCPILKKMNQYC